MIKRPDTKFPYPIQTVLLIGLIPLGFLLRLRLSSTLVIYPDSVYYLSQAKAILKGHLFFDFVNGEPNVQQPLYPLLTSFLSLFTGDVEHSAIIISALFGALLIFPVFFLARNLYGEKAAWLAFLLILLDPLLIHWSAFALTESLFIFLFITLIALTWSALQHDKWYLYFLAGAVAGLCYLTRVIGGVTVLIPISSILLSRKISRDNYSHILFSVTLAGAGAVIATTPHLLYIHSLFGEWRISGFSPYGGIWENLNKTYFLSIHLRFLTEYGIIGIIIARCIHFVYLYSKILITVVPIVILFSLISFVWSLRIYKSAGKDFYLLFSVLLYGSFLILFAHEVLYEDSIRLLTPVVPLFLILASNGIIRFTDWIVSVAKWKNFFTGLSFLFLASLVIVLPYFEFNRIQRYGVRVRFERLLGKKEYASFYKMVGLELKEVLPERPRIMARKPWVVYYANGIWFGTPDLSYDKVIDHARSYRIDYLLVDSSVDPSLRPKIAFLLNLNAVPSELELIERYEINPLSPEDKGSQIVLYRIRR